MFLKHLKLTNFRNFIQCDFNFQTPATILVGDNAQGKSNFLESIYYLATTKSDRVDKEEELIRYGEDFLRVEGLAGNTNLEIAIQVIDHQLKKRVKVNGIPRRVIDYSGNLAVVMFSPEDINLVTGPPSLRRTHLDHVLSQVDRHYRKAIINYEEVVVRKNRILKAIREKLASVDQLTFWSDQQIRLAEVVTEQRRQFFESVNSVEKKIGQFQFEYLENILSQERLADYQVREIDTATSLIGPHRDDFVFKLEGRDLSRFGSRGEQRTAVLDLKMAELIVMERSLGDRPILLLDDIFSELDLEHRKHVVELVKLQQTIITSVEEDGFLNKAFTGAKILAVANGQLALKADK